MTASEVIVKVTTQHPAWPLLRQTPAASGRWGRYVFHVNTELERCDQWIVCDGLVGPETTWCPAGNTMLITWEPPTGVRQPYDPKFLAQFGSVLACDRALVHHSVLYGQQAHPWFVERTYDELDDVDPPCKSQPLVIITSDKAFSPGHRARIDFAMALKDYFGSDARLVGRGIEDFDNKWDVLAPARYAVAVENAVYDDWVTEKLPDCYLAAAFPLYHGAPNVDRYFSPASFEQVDVGDVSGACRLIERLLADESHYERSLPHLLAARQHYLRELQLFPMIAGLLDRRGAPAMSTVLERVALRPEHQPSSLTRRVSRRLLRR